MKQTLKISLKFKNFLLINHASKPIYLSKFSFKATPNPKDDRKILLYKNKNSMQENTKLRQNLHTFFR